MTAPAAPAVANAANMASPSFRLAALDTDFILSEEMRGLRFMLEYQKPEAILRNWRIASTIVVFGSARIRPDGPGDQARWYAEAMKFGNLVSREGGALDGDGGDRQNVIATGGGPGLMEAANRGAMEAGAPTIGYNITLPHEQEPNAYTTPDLTFRFHYFNMRKMHLVMRANALVAFPGGFGTMDELFEIVTLVQTGKAPKIPILLFDSAFWDEILNVDAFVKHGMIAPADVDLMRKVDSADEAWRYLKPIVTGPKAGH